MPARSDSYSKAPRAARHEPYVSFPEVLETTCAAPRERAAFIHESPRRGIFSETGLPRLKILGNRVIAGPTHARNSHSPGFVVVMLVSEVLLAPGQ